MCVCILFAFLCGSTSSAKILMIYLDIEKHILKILLILSVVSRQHINKQCIFHTLYLYILFSSVPCKYILYFCNVSVFERVSYLRINFSYNFASLMSVKNHNNYNSAFEQSVLLVKYTTLKK